MNTDRQSPSHPPPHMPQSPQTWVTGSLLARFALSATSAAASEAVTFPIDLTKTRMQLETAKGVTPRALPLAASIVRHEGVPGLYRGITPAVARHIPYTGTRILVYETLRQRFAEGGSADALPIQLKMLSGLISGAVGQFVAVPADLVKVRMQAAASSTPTAGGANRPRYRGMWHALTTIAREEGGVRGLWRGSSPAVQRAALVNLGELATYDTAKSYILRHVCRTAHLPPDPRTGKRPGDDIWTHVAASICSGFFASLVSTPADVIKTRVMNQDPHNPKYTGTVDCFVKSVRSEGFRALYKGFFPTWARLGPWQLVFWVTYERLRALTGLGNF